MKPRKKSVVFPRTREICDTFEVHDHGLNVADFSIYLVGTPMSYSDDDDNFVEPGVEYQMATQFIKNLNILSGRNPKRPILIHMKTNGGIRQEGMAIYDAILACPNPVTILGYTFAVSMSSIILQAADKRALMPHCLFLFHEGALSLNGTMKEVWTNADWTKKVEIPEMLSIYAGRLKQKGKYRHLPIERIKKILQGYMDKKEDVYLSAKEAVEWGFADEVFGADGVYDWTALRKF